MDSQSRFCAKCGNVVASAAPAASRPIAATGTAPAMAPPPPQPSAMSSAPPSGSPQQYGAVPPGYMQTAPYTGTAPVAGVTPYAGFWMRVGAYVLDILILLIPLGLLSLIPILGVVGNIVGLWLYFALQESSERQATIGKRALNIYVTDQQGRRISFGQATGRHFAKFLSGFILCIGYMMAGFTQKKQALHDMIAGTLVMRR